MIFARQAGTSLVLVMLTLSLHCAGMGAVIAWARNTLASDVYRLGPFRPAVLMVRFITAFIVLHILEILLWAGFYRWLCFPSGKLPFTSRQAVMPRWAMAMSFSRKRGGR